jgi:hypothetical protein
MDEASEKILDTLIYPLSLAIALGVICQTHAELSTRQSEQFFPHEAGKDLVSV